MSLVGTRLYITKQLLFCHILYKHLVSQLLKSIISRHEMSQSWVLEMFHVLKWDKNIKQYLQREPASSDGLSSLPEPFQKRLSRQLKNVNTT